MAGSMDVIEFVAREALTNEDKFKRLTAQLGDSSRRNRQNAAGSLAFIAKVSPELLVPYASDLVDALNRPEAQTRWESLDALTALVPVESRCTDKALAGAENALFDEENGFVRLAAMRFFCAYGATTEKRSENDRETLGKSMASHRRGHPVLSRRCRVQRHAECCCGVRHWQAFGAR